MYKRIILISILNIIMASFPASSPAPTRECGDKIPLVVAQILWRDFGRDERFSAYLRGTNDVMCREKENMANIAMVVFDKKLMEYFYAILHVHFNDDGGLIGTPGSMVNWKSTKNEDDWKNEWCNFIGTVYPEEIIQQGCHR